MSGQSLAQKLDALAEFGQLNLPIPETVTTNLASAIVLRPYQETALRRFLFYMDWAQRQKPAHLLFHMATGSGKTVMMAALILELYTRGQRNFLFFVNSTQIIEKTKANFIDAVSSKFLFADPVRFEGKPVAVREVSNFDEADAVSINIHFTTIQGLHSRMANPRENGVSVEDFAGREVVLISDEAHHLNADTKKNQGELELEASWEGTVNAVFRANPGNLLLEFTATANLGHAAIAAKYHDKILYDYSLRQFRADRYSKEIELRRADISLEERMLQAAVLSQYRRKLAGEHGLSLKPVVMLKSRRVADSAANEEAFHALIEGLDGARLEAMMAALTVGDTVGDALRQVLRDPQAFSGDDFAREIRLDFAPAKVRNVNKPEDLQRQQIELNSLEDRDNEVRCIFAVDKLNEGWDVLNLFDIVRLYDQGTNTTTNQEAQLIGRGARYWPFVAPDRADEPREQRKYDEAEEHPLRLIEQLHYHCTHNPVYVADIRKALVESGLIDADARKASVRVKDGFRQSDFFSKGLLFENRRQKNERCNIFSFADYSVPELIRLAVGHSGRTSEGGAFDGADTGRAGAAEGAIDLTFAKLGQAVVRHALDANPFFHFANLKRHFPKLTGMADFIGGTDYLGGIKLEVSGPKGSLAALDAAARLSLASQALERVAAAVSARSHDFVGTRRFEPAQVSERVEDLTLTVGGAHRKRWREVPENDGIDLAALDWFVHDDFYGTSNEMELIRLIASHIDAMRDAHGQVYLLRNEKALKLYAFMDGAGFEPDFLLYLERDFDGTARQVEIYLEPKGAHLAEHDIWKQDFLLAIGGQHELPEFYTKSYRLEGWPFFDPSDWRSRAAFKDKLVQFKGADLAGEPGDRLAPPQH